MSHNPLGVSGLKALTDAVCGGVLAKLRTLKLEGCLSSDETTDQAFIEALSTNCPLLTKMELSKNNLNSFSVTRALARFVSSRSWSSFMYISEAMLGDNGFNSFINSLMIPCSISKLQVDGNGIRGLSCLADGVCSGKINMTGDMYHFDSGFSLDDNPIGLKGTVAIGRILSSGHYQSKSLSLSRCQLTTVNSSDIDINLQSNQSLDDSDGTQSSNVLNDINVGKYLTQLSQNSCITYLSLDGNNFSGEGIHILAGFLHLCPFLKTLSSEDCGINSDDLQHLLEQLQLTKPSSFLSPCSKLELWYLDNNNINDRGVSLLMDHLSLFPQFGAGGGAAGVFFDWSFDGSPISLEVADKFKEETYDKYVSSAINQCTMHGIYIL